MFAAATNLTSTFANLFLGISSPFAMGEDYKPVPAEIVALRRLLVEAKKLPVDIVDSIFDFAEFWAHSSNEIDYRKEIQGPLIISGGSKSEDKFMLRAFPVGMLGFREKKNLAEVLAYDMNEAKPKPLDQKHDAEFYSNLTDYPFPRLVHPVRKIVFSIRSKDQGWGGERANHGTYKGSWTWFDVGLERYDASQTCDGLCTADLRYESEKSQAPTLPICALRPIRPKIEPKDNTKQDGEFKYAHTLLDDDDMAIQRNVCAKRDFKEHVVTWSWDDQPEPNVEEIAEEVGRGKKTFNGKFVNELIAGDVVTVWGKARFGGWANHVERIKIDVYWAV